MPVNLPNIQWRCLIKNKKAAKGSPSYPFSLSFVKVIKFCPLLKNRQIIQMSAAPRVCLATVFKYVVCKFQKPCRKTPHWLWRHVLSSGPLHSLWEGWQMQWGRGESLLFPLQWRCRLQQMSPKRYWQLCSVMVGCREKGEATTETLLTCAMRDHIF